MEGTQDELKNLYEAAKKFEKVKPWQWVSEYQLLVVEDPETHIMGFCCIMGNQSDEIGVKVYLGIEGLRDYLNMLDSNELSLEDDVIYSQLSRETCLAARFDRYVDFRKQDYEQLKEVGLEWKGKDAIPQFRDCLAGFLPVSIKEGWQCRFLSQALLQLSELSVLMKEHQVFKLENDEVLLRLQDFEGDWKTLKVSLSIFLDQLGDTGAHYENELAAYRISKLPSTSMVFEVAQFLMPRPVEEPNNHRAYFPMITAILEKETKQLVFAEMTNPSLQSQENILTQFANTLLKDLEFKPDYLVTDSEPVLRHFKDFCQKTKIPMKQVAQLEAAHEFVSDLLKIEEQFTGASEDVGMEEEIDLVLSTTKEICKTILECDTLTDTLTSKAKSQFTNIMELFHIVMLGHFKELPDHWTVKNVERACKEILPELLSEEELTCVPSILTHYLDVVGGAELIPNYVNLQQCVEQIYS